MRRATVAAIPGERAWTNLALLYGGVGRWPACRAWVAPADGVAPGK